MRFLMMVKATKESETGQMPDEKLLSAMAKFNEEKVKAGVFLDGAGLKPSSFGARLRLAGGRITVVDGPFAEAKEVIGGWAICELPSKEAAIELAREFLEVHRQVLGDSYE